MKIFILASTIKKIGPTALTVSQGYYLNNELEAND